MARAVRSEFEAARGTSIDLVVVDVDHLEVVVLEHGAGGKEAAGGISMGRPSRALT